MSLGWIGAVLTYLALVTAAVSGDAQQARAAWSAMALIGWAVLVPLAITSLGTGIVVSLSTPWGLFRHYWVLISFALTVFATVVLISHMPGVSAMADTLRSGIRESGRGDYLHAGGGLVVLLVIAILNVYKPRGLTPYGWRKAWQEKKQRQEAAL